MGIEQRVIRDSRQNVINWYGFIPTKDENPKQCYLEIEKELGMATLYNISSVPIKISFFHLIKENYGKSSLVHTENEIWNYLYEECKNHVEPETEIYINEFEIEEGIARDICQCQYETMQELEIEAYFEEQKTRYDS